MSARSSARRPLVILALGAGGLILAAWGCGLIARADAGPLDLSAVRALASVRTPALTGAARALSEIGSAYVVVPLALLVSAALLARGHRRAGALVALGSLGAIIIAQVVKALVARPRPPVHHLEHVASYSFPSGHASQSTGFLVGAVLAGALLARAAGGHSRRRLVGAAAVIAVLLAGAVGWSRIYLAVHYPTDVGAGLAIGLLWNGAVWRALTLRPPGRAQD